ncbi:MAG TPA: hypothetical protein VFL91_16245 [Thermomicrobiales bacterium]|nr:hypothetical protein [Thermomicrobiales bacterium]
MADATRPRLREAPFAYTQTLVPGAKDALTNVVKVLWDPEGAVPEQTKELVFLRSSIVNKCDT